MQLSFNVTLTDFMPVKLPLWSNCFAHMDFSTLVLEGKTQLTAPYPAVTDYEPFSVTPVFSQGIGRTRTSLCLVLVLNCT